MRQFSFLTALCVVLLLTGYLAGNQSNNTPDQNQVNENKKEPTGDVYYHSNPGELANTPLLHPEVRFVGEKCDEEDLLWGDDVLVVDTEYEDGQVDIVSSSSGDYFLVVEHPADYSIRVYRSSDGGGSWWWYLNFYDYSYDLNDPALAVPELDEDYLYVIYEFADQMQVARTDLSTDQTDFYNVEVNSGGLRGPRIVTDNIDYPGNYWLYVVYISYNPVDSIVSYDIKAARSTDDGVTWEAFHAFSNQSFNWVSDPDITFGGGNLYAVWDEFITITDWGVRVSKSTNLGYSWGDPEVISDLSRECFNPRVAAIQNGDEVVVAYSDEWDYYDKDIRYSYSTDGGSNWSTNNCLDCDYDNELWTDICVDPDLGSFHVTYWKENDVMYSYAPYTNPTSWSSPETINDTNEASYDYSPPTVAVDWTSGEAGVAWSDDRTSTNAIYFDRADWVSGPDLVIDIQPVNGTVFNPGDWIIYAVTLTNNSTSPIQVTASAYASNVSDWRLNLFGPITLTIQGQSTIGPVNLQNQVPMGAPPMTAYICAEANSVHDCYQVTIQ